MLRLTVILLLLVLTVPAVSQADSHRDAARELLRLMDADAVVDQSYDQFKEHFAVMADQMGIASDQHDTFERHFARIIEVMKEEMSWAKMEPYMIDAYVSVYTEEEIRQIAEFYSSPIGRKLVAKTPELMAVTMQLTQDMLQDFLPRLQEIQEEMRAELANERQSEP